MSRFDSVQSSLQGMVMQSFNNGKIDKLEKLHNSFSIGEVEKRMILDQLLRDCILKLSSENKEDLKRLEKFVTYAIELSRREICSASVPVLLLSDIFDVFTLDQCEKLFSFVENGVMTWKEDLFFGACKNNLLRMCNDLLRRLSRSQNTVFRGRILLFLAKFFPFSERSADIAHGDFRLTLQWFLVDALLNMESEKQHFCHFLLFYFRKGENAVQTRKKLSDMYGDMLHECQCQNCFETLILKMYHVQEADVEADEDTINSLMQTGLNIASEFNLDNVTEYSQEASQIEDFEATEDTKEETKFKIDYNFYNKFLTLQDFMRSPNQCYNKVRWRVFVNSATDVLATFQNFKLDADHFQDKPIQDHLTEASASTFFAKYMTNPKLLELQLSDPDFRRSILIQFLIVLQYLSSPVKFKLGSYELKQDQQDWIREQVLLVYSLLAETPANSAKFAESVKHMLAREELWNNWKNAGCPEFKKPTNLEEKDITKQKTKSRKRNIGELIKEATMQKKYYMGHTELTRLWNLNPNNLEACKAKERKFLPELDNYFEEAIMQMDPEAAIEPEYRKVNDPNFGWRALRLLTQRSTCFFASNNNPITRLPDYLELSLKKIIRDRPQNANEENKQEILNAETEEVEELLKQEDKEPQEDGTEESVPEPRIAPDLLESVAKHVGDQWKKLALKIGVAEKEIEKVAQEKSTDTERAERMLKIWAEVDEDATPENLAYTLEGLNLISAAEVLKPKTSVSE